MRSLHSPSSRSQRDCFLTHQEHKTNLDSRHLNSFLNTVTNRPLHFQVIYLEHCLTKSSVYKDMEVKVIDQFFSILLARLDD